MRACKHILQLVITEDMFGEVEVIPPLVIILDKAECSGDIVPTESPPPTQVTPPPTPGPDKPKPCTGLYDIIRTTLVEPFTCKFLHNSCEDGIICQLSILDTTYVVVLSVSKQQTDLILEVKDTDNEIIGRGSSSAISITLPKPQGSNLTMSQKYDSQTATVGLQVDTQCCTHLHYDILLGTIYCTENK